MSSLILLKEIINQHYDHKIIPMSTFHHFSPMLNLRLNIQMTACKCVILLKWIIHFRVTSQIFRASISLLRNTVNVGNILRHVGRRSGTRTRILGGSELKALVRETGRWYQTSLLGPYVRRCGPPRSACTTARQGSRGS